jgi:hypothetical protein
MLFWADIGKQLIVVHVVVGLIVVVSLFTLALLASRAGASRPLAITAMVWPLAVLAVGASQTSLLHGSLHWIIQVVHLLLGVGAMGLASLVARDVLPRGATVSWDDEHDPAAR